MIVVCCVVIVGAYDTMYGTYYYYTVRRHLYGSM